MLSRAAGKQGIRGHDDRPCTGSTSLLFANNPPAHRRYGCHAVASPLIYQNQTPANFPVHHSPVFPALPAHQVPAGATAYQAEDYFSASL